MAYTPRGSYGGNIDLYGSTLMDLYTEALTDDELLEALSQIIELGAGPEQLANLFSSSRYQDRDNGLWLELAEEMLQGRDPTSFRPPVGDFRTNSMETRDSILDRFREKGLYTPPTPPVQVPAENPTAPLTSPTSSSAIPTTPASGPVASSRNPRFPATRAAIPRQKANSRMADVGFERTMTPTGRIDWASAMASQSPDGSPTARPERTINFGTRGTTTIDPKKHIGSVPDGIYDIIGEDPPGNNILGTPMGTPPQGTAPKRGGLLGMFDDFFGQSGRGGVGADPKSYAKAPGTNGGSGIFGRLFAPELSGNLTGIGDTLSNPQFNYTAGTGLKGWGKNLGGWYTGIKGGADAIGILNNLSDSAKEKTNTQDLQSDILTAAMSNPMSTYSLTSDQLKLLGDIRAGRRDVGADFSDFDMGAGLKGALTGALTGLPGGLTGAILGGVGGLMKEGTAGLAAGQQRRNAELEALYQTLNASNVDYKNAMRQRMMQRYF